MRFAYIIPPNAHQSHIPNRQSKTPIIQSVVVVVLIIIAVFILFFDIPMPKGSMTLEEINSARQELIQITESTDE